MPSQSGKRVILTFAVFSALKSAPGRGHSLEPQRRRPRDGGGGGERRAGPAPPPAAHAVTPLALAGARPSCCRDPLDPSTVRPLHGGATSCSGPALGSRGSAGPGRPLAHGAAGRPSAEYWGARCTPQPRPGGARICAGVQARSGGGRCASRQPRTQPPTQPPAPAVGAAIQAPSRCGGGLGRCASSGRARTGGDLVPSRGRHGPCHSGTGFLRFFTS